MNVYDFDGTIYDGDSSIDFYFFVLRKKPYLFFLFPVQLWGIVKYYINMSSKESMKEAFFIFIRFISLQKMVSEFWERNNHKIKKWYLQQKQDTDVIISASPEFLLSPVCNNLIASCIDARTGIFHGKNCYGAEKLRRFKEKYKTETIDNFYSDNISDTPLAEIATRAFKVIGNRIEIL
jgi:phosphoserine phosphatase